jgi:two-component system, NarL family, sensor kinase
VSPVPVAWILAGAGAALLAGGVVAALLLWPRTAPGRPRPVRVAAVLLAAAALVLASVAVRAVAGPGEVVRWLWMTGAFVLLPVAVALYPNGRPPPGFGWLPVVVVAAAGGLSLVSPAHFVGDLGALLPYLLLLAVQWWRFEHDDAAGRRALLWLALGSVPGPLLAVAFGFAEFGPAGVVASGVAWVVFVACLCIGLAAPGMRDVHRPAVTVAVNLVGGLLVASVFATAVSAVEWVTGRGFTLSPGALGVIAAACALAYVPTARVLRVLMELLLFGPQSDPIRAASRAGERLTDDPVRALQSLRESLTLPYAALVDGSGRVVAASGQPPESIVRHPVSAADPALGHLAVGLRPDQPGLHATDVQVLAVLAPALAQLMHARALRMQLADSRAAVVAAVEEERRRLRRDLHDGLGPQLTGVAYAADAARNVLDRQPARAADLLAGLRAEAGEAILEVRRLVEGLRPASLDQVGLEQALRQHARHVHGADGRPMTVAVQAAEGLPALGAAVEVTAYRIAVEAVTNAARHSGGDRATITLATDGDALVIEVTDNGRAATPWTPGVGLTSMRERAELLGGTVVTHAGHDGGRVRACLPLVAAPGRGSDG